MPACFKIEGDWLAPIHLLNKTQIQASKISVFWLKIFTSMSVLWIAFLLFTFLIYVRTSSSDTFCKVKFSPVVMLLISSTLGCFQYLKITFRTGCKLFFSSWDSATTFWYSRVFDFFFSLRRKLFQNSYVSVILVNTFITV